jgi:hypothetical protein
MLGSGMPDGVPQTGYADSLRNLGADCDALTHPGDAWPAGDQHTAAPDTKEKRNGSADN